MFLIIGAGWGCVAAMRSWREEGDSQSRQPFNVCSLLSLLFVAVFKSIQNFGVDVAQFDVDNLCDGK